MHESSETCVISRGSTALNCTMNSSRVSYVQFDLDLAKISMMALTLEVWSTLVLVALGALVAYQLITKVLYHGLWEPLWFRRIMTKQGVKGPPFRFLIGNLYEQQSYLESLPEVVPLDSYAALSPTVTPQYALYFPRFPGEKYFMFAIGTVVRLAIRDAEITKELLVNNHAFLKKSTFEEWFIKQIFGTGLLIQVGKKWTTGRQKIIPFFYHEALKGMLEAMVEGADTEIQNWEQIVAKAGGSAEIDVEADIHRLSGRILSLTAFGSADFATGEQVYELETELGAELYGMARKPQFWLIPFYRNLPTKRNRRINGLISKIDELVRGVMKARLEAVRTKKVSSFGNDLLGRMLTAASDGWDEDAPEFNLSSVLSNCKFFYFAGQDTVANTIGFSMLMLALHPEWQQRARKEVLEVVGDKSASLDATALPRLKVVGMVVNETLRTLSPAPTLAREVTKDVQLKNLFIPKGMIVEFALGAMNQDKDYWGDDVAEFNPERFANGVLGACSHPLAFSPFGLGPKSCIGNNFTMMEIKIVLAKVLQRFEILPSPNYKHHPTFDLAPVTRPKYGLPLIFKARQ